MRETVQGIPVLRSWVLASPNQGVLRRTLDQVSFAITALLAAAMLPEKPDVLSVDIHPIFLCVTARVLSRIWGIPYVVVAGDLHPEMAVDLGALTNPLAVRVVRELSQFVCRGAAAIAPMTAGIRRLLVARGFPPESLELIHYGADTSIFRNNDLWQPIPRELAERLHGKFVFGYVGTHGVSQGLRIVLDTAERLRHHADIVFLMMGDGAEKAALSKEAAIRDLQNIIFWDPLPHRMIPSVYAHSDACLVSLRRLRTFREGGLPSKLFEIMAAGKAVVVAAEGEPADIIQRSRAGIAISPENSAMLASAVLQLQSSGPLREEMGRRGQAYIEANLSRERQSAKYEQLFLKVID